MKKLIFYILILLTVACSGKKTEKSQFEGEYLPSFQLLLPDSAIYDTKNIQEGKPLVFISIGPHCPYSKAQIEEILQNIDEFKDVSFYIITRWPFTDMKKLYSNYNLSNYKNITTGRDVTQYFSNHYKTPGVPYTIIYGKDKKVKQAAIGTIKSNALLELIYK